MVNRSTTDKFKLEIELGNEAMSDHFDIANALRNVSDKLYLGQMQGKIYDRNGNTVGEFVMIEEGMME